MCRPFLAHRHGLEVDSQHQDRFSNPTIERALLGAFLTEPKRLREIDEVSADYFSLSSHRMIYRAMAALGRL
jgi:replicative DNA helicase